MPGNYARHNRKKNMNEEKTKESKTEVVSGPGSIQRGPRREIEILEELAFAAKKEAEQFTARGYGGYIESGELAKQRDYQASLIRELPPEHRTRVRWEKDHGGRN